MPLCVESLDPDALALGRALIGGGKVGCIVLAGGDGSRLGWAGPKGSFPISLVKQKTLFQMVYERAIYCAQSLGAPLHFAIMTSPLNQSQTLCHFPKEIDYFDQRMLPLLDENKEPTDNLRPNGNGEVLSQFYRSGLYDAWKDRGVECVQIVLIDNLLAEPLDPIQVGLGFKHSADLSLKVVDRMSPDEKVGVVGIKDGKIKAIEYSANPPKDWTLANTSLFCFHMDFVKKVKELALPIYQVPRVIDGQKVYKQECFIFDLMEKAQSPLLIRYDREDTFAPLKNRSDVGNVQKALLKRDQKALFDLTGQKAVGGIFELHPKLHFPSEEMKDLWKGKSFCSSSGYITP